MNTESCFTPRQPVARSRCLDCLAEFARHRAIQRQAGTITRDLSLDLLICPECGSQSVEESCHDRH